MTPRLSILICHLESRKPFLERLLKILEVQKEVFPIGYIEIIINPHPTDSIGRKRNDLLNAASGEYVAFIDDDDRISDNYIWFLFEGIKRGVDCCSLKGIITEDNKNPKTFIHSIKYDSWFEKDNIYYRNANHLNCVKSSIAKQMKFPEKNHGEDRSYSEQLLKSGLLKTEHYIRDVIYYYDYRSKK